MQTLNVLVPDLSPSQRSYFLIRNTNAIHINRPDINVQVFIENVSLACMRTNFSVMNVAEAWAQPGPIIATSLSTAAKLIHYPCATRKLFYLWDLEWIRGSKIYNHYAPVYLNKELELVCRSKEHADLVSTAFNKEVKYIVEDFNIDGFLEIVNEVK